MSPHHESPTSPADKAKVPVVAPAPHVPVSPPAKPFDIKPTPPAPAHTDAKVAPVPPINPADAKRARQAAAFKRSEAIRRIHEGMDVLSADNQKVGTVDSVQGFGVKILASDNKFKFLPTGWVDDASTQLKLTKTKAEVASGWKDNAEACRKEAAETRVE